MEYAGDLRRKKTELFLREGLDRGANQFELVQQIGLCARTGGTGFERLHRLAEQTRKLSALSS
jgi:hypothetical protein